MKVFASLHEPTGPTRDERRVRRGFTLVEMLVAIAILGIIMLLLMLMTNNVFKIWKYSNSKIETFREARDAFEVMTRRIGQATLGSYWGYNPPLALNSTPLSYQRLSDLQIVLGLTGGTGSGTGTLLGTPAAHPGSAIFFFAPLGYDTTNTASPSLINMCGYYIEFNSDASLRPAFVGGAAHYRYRLMQVLEPSSQITIYNYTSGLSNTLGNPGYSYDGNDWFNNPVYPARVMAENIILLTLIPHLSAADDPNRTILPPSYSYDSRNSASAVTLNQLPPLVDVTMVAIDEASASRLAQGSTEPTYGIKYSGSRGAFQSAANYATDLANLEKNLVSLKITFQVFTSTVPIEEAKWSIK